MPTFASCVVLCDAVWSPGADTPTAQLWSRGHGAVLFLHVCQCVDSSSLAYHRNGTECSEGVPRETWVSCGNP